MERTYRAKNGVMEKVRFAVSSNSRMRSSKRNRSTPRKQESNRNQAIHILGRILNNNFAPGDILLTLTYDDAAYGKLTAQGEKAGKEEQRSTVMEAAEKQARNFLRRLKGSGLKDNKTVLVTADMDGTTGELVRVHHHLVISGRGTKLVREGDKLSLLCPDGRTLHQIWGRGTADWELLRGGSYSRLAGYLLRQTWKRKDKKSYTCSRNMEAIAYTEREIASLGQEIRVPAGSVIEERMQSQECAAQYVRYIPPRKQPKRGGHRKAAERWKE